MGKSQSLIPASSLKTDGHRNFVHPADVSGRFVTRRYLVFAVLIAIWAALPWIQINGHPAMYLDVPGRRFFMFGATFNAQDAWLVFFLITGLGLTILFLTTLLGRVWCGWACPQTVFLEGIFRRIERAVEGPRNTRVRRNEGPWNVDKVWRKALKHVLFIASALFVAHVFLSFFVSLPSLFQMVQRPPSENPRAFVWVTAMSVIFYANFAWFREQLCIIVCPYGRLQSALTDRNTLVVGYDEKRGEPRGKASDREAGDCIDCKRCVVVCPTGIDIRNGLQLDCVGCTACIDACDEVMDKLQRPRGLVRYDSLNGLEHRPKRIWRPRLALYIAVITAWSVGAFFAFRTHSSFETHIARIRGAPYHLVEDGTVARNLFTLHLVNKKSDPARFLIEPVESELHRIDLRHREIEIGALEARDIPVYVDVVTQTYEPGAHATMRVQRAGEDESLAHSIDLPLLGPRR